jgi:glucose-6-phosphate 1-dehydrogenase
MSVCSAIPCGETHRFSPAKDSVEAAWRLIDPILRNVTPVHEYEPKTWGPEAAETLIARDGHKWLLTTSLEKHKGEEI